MIEKGRHLWLDRNERLCPFCSKNDISIVETEFHFLMECMNYETVRKDILGNIIVNRRDKNTFIMLMSSKDSNLIHKVSKFIHIAFQIRKNQLTIATLA